MKHRGSISQTYLRRDNKAVPDLYRRARAMAEYPTTTMDIFRIAASLPVDTFYIADDAALSYIRSRIYNNERRSFRNKYKQKLFDALYDEVSRMLEETRYQEMGLASTVIVALSRPAPCVGLTPGALYLAYRRWCIAGRKKKEEMP